MSVVIGWDVGGAHLKAARAENGRVVAALQIASPLWLGVSSLDEAFVAAQRKLGAADLHAVTMTGELSMAFRSRAEGVGALAAAPHRRWRRLRCASTPGAPASCRSAASAPSRRTSPRPIGTRARRDRKPLPGRAFHRHGLHHQRYHPGNRAPSLRAATPTPSASPPANWSTPAWCAPGVRKREARAVRGRLDAADER